MTIKASPQGCPLCGGNCALWLRKHGRTLVRCTLCRFISVIEGVAVDHAGVSIYESEQHIFQEHGNAAYYLDASNLTSARDKLAWVARYAPPSSRLLDVGASFGHFLKAAEHVYRATGFELSPQAVAWSREHFGVNTRIGSIYGPPSDLDGPFDAVTCWDVIEHVPDAVSAVRSLRMLVRPGGHLFLSTPDAQSAVARLTGRSWHYLDPIQHISLFGRRNLVALLEANGFKLESVRALGHHYRVGYIADRLRHLHGGTGLQHAARAASALLAPFSRRSVFIKLGDVMGIVARRVDD